MKVLLIQAPWSTTTGGPLSKLSTRFVFYPPMGLLSLAAFVEQHGHQADVLDLEAEYLEPEKLLEIAAKPDVGLIGFTASTPVFFISQAYARMLRAKIKTPIVVGGPHVSVVGEQALTEEFDYAIRHEGEQSLLALMDALSKGEPLSTINGLIYREGTSVKVNPPRAFLEDLDSLPFPARAKLDRMKYRFEVPGKGLVPIASTALTRGCPFKCVFCSEPQNAGRRLRTRSPKNVVDEFEEIKRLGCDHVYLLDSTLTLNRKLVEDFCEELITRNLKMTFEGHTRAPLVDRPLLELMKRAGLVRLIFGLESADLGVLKLMRKEIKPEDIRRAFRLCKDLEIDAITGVMMGNPGDTRKTILKTAWFVRSISEIKYAPMAIAIPYPGTELFDMAVKGMHGLRLLEADYKKYSRYSGGVMEVDGMSPAELLRLQRKALVIMHSTPAKIVAVIKHFGFMNLIFTLWNMVRSEYFTRVCGYDPVLKNISDENTTLRSMGLVKNTK